MVKNPPPSAARVASIPGLRASPGVGTGNPLSILAWKTPWTEEPGGYSPRGCKELNMA